MQPESEITRSRCPFCLGDIPSQARKCVHCGEWISSFVNQKNKNTNNIQHNANKPKIQWKILMGIIGIILSTITLGISCNFRTKTISKNTDEILEYSTGMSRENAWNLSNRFYDHDYGYGIIPDVIVMISIVVLVICILLVFVGATEPKDNK